MSTQEEIDEEKKLFTTPTFNLTRAQFQNRNKGVDDAGKPVKSNATGPTQAQKDNPKTITKQPFNERGGNTRAQFQNNNSTAKRKIATRRQG
jgi:hypothetical protein